MTKKDEFQFISSSDGRTQSCLAELMTIMCLQVEFFWYVARSMICGNNKQPVKYVHEINDRFQNVTQ